MLRITQPVPEWVEEGKLKGELDNPGTHKNGYKNGVG